MTYYRNNYRNNYRPTSGPVDRPNKRAGECRDCRETVPAGAGLLYRETDGAWSVRHQPQIHGETTRSAPAPRDNRGGYIDECGSCGMASCAC